MKYLVFEIQTAKDGTVAVLTTQKEDLNEAQSVYYSVLAAAAISEVPQHAAVLMTNEGATLMFNCFTHKTDEARPEDGAVV